jgi:two-component system, cell cycle response regulator
VSDWEDTAVAVPESLREATTKQACLVVVCGSRIGETHLITASEVVIGRATGADLRIDDEGVSRFHCRLRQTPDGVIVEDLSSRNGTFCNGERVTPHMRPLVDGDRLQIGTTSVLRFTYAETTIPFQSVDFEDQGSVRDTSTGLFSRRYFLDKLNTEVSQALVKKVPLSLLLLHIDRFSEYDDSIASEIATCVAGHIRERVAHRPNDILARFANGEFALLMHCTTPGDTFMLAERIRTSSTALTFTCPKKLTHKITLSLAVAAMTELHITTGNELLIAAGRALQRAMHKGGNRVSLCTEDMLRAPKDSFIATVKVR